VTVTENLERIKGLTDRDVEYWHARDLMPVLGYVEWRNFKGAIERAMASFTAAGEEASHHFVETNKVMIAGKGAEHAVEDFFLSRAACYLIAMNGDSGKPEIAEAQQYFAVQTRRMEKLERLIADQRRVDLRNRVKDRNSKLNGTAQAVGVKRFGLFHGAGINAMYRMRLSDLKAKRGIADKEDWLDRQGVEELAANEFRITQTDSKIRRESIQGEDQAIKAHAEVGAEVRDAIRRVGNAMPENLPPEPPIKEIEKRLKPLNKIASNGSAT
jgi:DNA-damage-inducible protein D